MLLKTKDRDGFRARKVAQELCLMRWTNGREQGKYEEANEEGVLNTALGLTDPGTL